MKNLTFKQRFLIFLQLEDAPKWKQNLGIGFSIATVILVMSMVSLLTGLLSGNPSGENIPFI